MMNDDLLNFGPAVFEMGRRETSDYANCIYSGLEGRQSVKKIPKCGGERVKSTQKSCANLSFGKSGRIRP